MAIEKAFVVDDYGSRWEHFFLELESNALGEWRALRQNERDRDLWIEDDSERDYQAVKYRIRRGHYTIFIKKRFVVRGRDDLFNNSHVKHAGKYSFHRGDLLKSNNGAADFASAGVVYVLKKARGGKIERFRGERIKKIYENISCYFRG